MDQSNEQEERITHFLFADNCHFVARNIKVLATMFEEATKELMENAPECKKEEMEFTRQGS